MTSTAAAHDAEKRMGIRKAPAFNVEPTKPRRRIENAMSLHAPEASASTRSLKEMTASDKAMAAPA